MKLKNDKITYYPADTYDDKKIVTDPPQERLKFDWMFVNVSRIHFYVNCELITSLATL